jgi:hypothetical protein
MACGLSSLVLGSLVELPDANTQFAHKAVLTADL